MEYLKVLASWSKSHFDHHHSTPASLWLELAFTMSVCHSIVFLSLWAHRTLKKKGRQLGIIGWVALRSFLSPHFAPSRYNYKSISVPMFLAKLLERQRLVFDEVPLTNTTCITNIQNTLLPQFHGIKSQDLKSIHMHTCQSYVLSYIHI